jgi:hypothetical protein
MIEMMAEEAKQIEDRLRQEFSRLIKAHDPKFASTTMIEACTTMIAMSMVTIDPGSRDIALAQITKELDDRTKGFSQSWDAFHAGVKAERRRLKGDDE